MVGQIPKVLASTQQGTAIVKHFLTKAGSKAEVKVVENAVNPGGGYGMEIPCVYNFQGQKIYIELLRKLLDIDNNLSADMKQEKDTQNRKKIKGI